MRRAPDIVERHGLQFSAPRQRPQRTPQPRLDRFSAGGHPVEQAFAVKVFDCRDPGCVRLRLQIAPVDELSEGLLDGLRRRGAAAWPGRFGEHVVGAQMQAELALRCREDIENGAVQRRVVGHDMAE